jgi:hypothetical protein
MQISEQMVVNGGNVEKTKWKFSKNLKFKESKVSKNPLFWNLELIYYTVEDVAVVGLHRSLGLLRANKMKAVEINKQDFPFNVSR